MPSRVTSNSGLGQLRAALRGFAVERPLQLVALELVPSLERLSEHGEFGRPVLGEFGSALLAD